MGRLTQVPERLSQHANLTTSFPLKIYSSGSKSELFDLAFGGLLSLATSTPPSSDLGFLPFPNSPRARVLPSNHKLKDETEDFRTSLVVQWLRILLSMQGTQVQSLVWEDPACHRATKPVQRNYPRLCAPEPMCTGEASTMRKPHPAAREWPSLPTTRGKPVRSN